MHKSHLASLNFFITIAFFAANSAIAQQRIPSPYLRGVFPPGAKSGATVELKIVRGEWLDGANRIVFSHPGITAQQVLTEPDQFYPEPRPVPDAFSVTVDAAVPPGTYEVRAAVGGRISNPRKFLVEATDSVNEKEPNDDLEKATDVTATSIVYGAFENGYDYFRIKLAQGDRVLFDCQAERIDSRGDAVLFVADASGRELARSQNNSGREPVIDFTAPAAGEYFVCVYDLTYAADDKGSAGTPYRLAIGRNPRVEFADPPIVPRGTSTQVTLYGSNLGGTPSDIKLGGVTLEKTTATIAAPADPTTQPLPADVLLHPSTAGVDFVSYRHPVSNQLSNPIPIAVGGGPMLIEREPNQSLEQAQPIELPCDLVGHFDVPRDVDRYLIKVNKGDKLFLEAISQQLGLPTSPVIVVQQVVRGEGGAVDLREQVVINRKRLKFNDLRMPLEIEDPGQLWEAPADGEYCVLVKDTFGTSHGGRRYAYRLRIGPPQPDFRVIALADAEIQSENNNGMRSRAGLVRRGGGMEIFVAALRQQGFTGEITVTLENPPPGLTAEPLILGPNAYFGELVVRAAADAPATSAPVKVIAKAKLAGVEATRVARAIEITGQFQQANYINPARLADAVPLAIDDTVTVPCRVEEAQKQVWRTSRGGKLEIPLRLVKTDPNFAGNTTLKPIGAPQGMNVNTLALGGGNLEGKITLDFGADVPPGQFTLLMRGDTEVDYRRNVSESEQADKDKDRIVKVAEESQQLLQQSEQAKQQAESQAQQMEGLRNQAREAVGRAKPQAAQLATEYKQFEKQAAAAQKEMEKAAKQLETATAAVIAATDDAAKQAAQAAVQPATDAVNQRKNELDALMHQATEKQTQAKAADDEFAKSTTAMDDAEKKHDDAVAMRKQMTAAEQQARKDRQQAEKKRQKAEEESNRWKQIAQPNKYRVPVHATPIVIDVAAYPVTVKITPATPSVVAGESVMLALEATREFGFDGELNCSIRVPDGFQGPPYFEPVNKLEKGQNLVQLPLKIQPITKPGEYTFDVRISMNFNGRGLEKYEPFRIKIEPKPEAKP